MNVKKMNVIVNYFGYREPKGFTSNVNHWKFANKKIYEINYVNKLVDIRIPFNFDNEDFIKINIIINKILINI